MKIYNINFLALALFYFLQALIAKFVFQQRSQVTELTQLINNENNE